MGLQHELDVGGHDLETAADDGVVAAAVEPQERVGVERREVGGAHPAALEPSCVGAHFEHSDLIDVEHVARGGVDDAQLGAGVRAPDAAPLGRAPLLMITQRPPGDAAGELGGAVGDEHRDGVLVSNAMAVAGSSGAVPQVTTCRLARSAGSRSAASTVFNALGTNEMAFGRWRRTSSVQSSTRKRSINAMRRPATIEVSVSQMPLMCTSGLPVTLTPVARRGPSALADS